MKDQKNVYCLLGFFMRAIRDGQHQNIYFFMLQKRQLQDAAALPPSFDGSDNTSDEGWEVWLWHGTSEFFWVWRDDVTHDEC